MKIKSITFVSDYSLADPKAVITGVMVQSYLLGKTLAVRGWEVHALASTTAFPLGTYDHHDGMSLHWYPHRRFIPLGNVYRIWKWLRRTRTAVYYQRGRDILTGVIALYCRYSGKKFVWASAGEAGLERWKYVRQVWKKRRAWWKTLLLLPEAWINDMVVHYGIRHAHLVIVQTATQQIRFSETFKRNAIVLQSGHEMPQDVNRSLPLKILWIGSIKKVKQPGMFVELARRCRGMACEFWMAGQDADPGLADEVRRTANTVSNFRFLGPVAFEESGNLIARAHVLVNTTQDGYEGLPNAFVQAWLGGTVVLTLNANPDAVVTQRRLGYQCGDIDEMVSHVQRWIEKPDEWRELSDNCRCYGRDHFSIESIAAQLERAIETVVL